MTRSLTLSVVLLAALFAVDAAAQGIFAPMARSGEPLLGRRIPMVRDLQFLASGRGMQPDAIRRLARHGPVFPTREQLQDRLARDRNDSKRAVFAHELLRIGERSFESTFIGAFARAGTDSAGILARGLAFYATKEAVDALVRGLGRAPTASHAEDALASLGSRASPSLLEAAKAGASAPGVYRALGRLGETRARDLLVARVTEADPALARAASLGLVLLDPVAERTRAEMLFGMLELEERALLLRAWLAQDPEAASTHLSPEDLELPRVSLALAAASSPELDAVKARLLESGAARALGFIALAQSPAGRRSLLARPTGPELRPALALAVAHTASPEERAAFLDRLEALEDEGTTPLLRALLDPSAVALTSELFRALEHPDTFAVAAYLLAEPMKTAGLTARDRYRASLRAGLRSPDARARIGACAALSVFTDESAAPALVRALEDEAPIVRVAAARALVSMGAPAGKSAIRLAIRTELDSAAREALSAVAAKRPGESELGQVLFGGRATEIPNIMILFASGGVIAY